MYSAQPSTCRPMPLHSLGERENENANQNCELSLCFLLTRDPGQSSTNEACKVFDRCRYSDPLFEVPRDRRLLQKVHGVCDKDLRCAYTLTPHAELYRGFKLQASSFNMHTSGTVEPCHHLTGHGQPFLSCILPTLPLPPHLSPPRPCTILPLR